MTAQNSTAGNLPLADRFRSMRLNAHAAVAYLQKEHGITIAAATLAKYRCHGCGPAFQKTASRSILYSQDALDTWADEHLGNVRTSTAT